MGKLICKSPKSNSFYMLTNFKLGASTDMSSTTYTTILPAEANSYIMLNNNYVLTKSLAGLTDNDVLLLETNTTFTNTYEGKISTSANTITFTLNAVPSSAITLIYNIVKGTYGGVL